MDKALFYEHLKLVQSQVEKFDDLASKIKTWTVTVWVALLGWSFNTHQDKLVWLSLVVVVIFWFLDALNKNFRQDYRQVRDEMVDELNGQNTDFVLRFPKHKLGGVVRQIFQPHLFLVYFTLLVLSLLALYS